jgi:LuxR family transcriptional regulator, maltose regulon positive regulatory protein
MHDRGIRACDDLSYGREGEYLTLARVLIAQRRSDLAGGSIHDPLHLLERLRQAAATGGRTGSVIESHMLRAQALETQGDQNAALTALPEALTLAATEGYVRLFVDEGAPMQLLIAGCRLQIAQRTHDESRGHGGRLLAYIDTLLAAFPERLET